MKRFVFAFTLAGVAAVAAPAQAQNGRCAGGNAVQNASQDACQVAVDMFRYMAPQLGTAIAGGNAVLGSGGTLGGIGHFSIGVRGNGVFGSLPNLDDVTLSSEQSQQRDLVTENKLVPMPVLDGALGIFKGLPLGVTNVGGIDLLLSAAYLPSVGSESDNVYLEVPDGSWKVGYGARVGLLQESLVTPGLSFSYIKRDLPTVNVIGHTQLDIAPGGAVTLVDMDVEARDLKVETAAWRVTASKNLLVVGVAAGVGQDKYDFSGTARARGAFDGSTATVRDESLDFSMTRTNYFANLSFNVMLLKTVIEFGQVSGGNVTTYNRFDKPADDSRFYASAGFRFGF